MRKTLFYIAVTAAICLVSFLFGMSITDTKSVTVRSAVTTGTQDYKKAPGEPVASFPYTEQEYYTREAVNKEVNALIQQDQLHRVLDIYGYLSRDRAVTEQIVNNALRYDIPINLLFALIQTESGFRTDLVIQNNNGSIDYGIMQCNSRTFTRYSPKELLDPRTNLKLGSEYLIKMKKMQNTWEMAVYRYNGTGSQAVKHMVKVITQEREIDRIVNRYL